MSGHDDRCKERYRNFSCCLAVSFNHEVHVAVDHEGNILARWRMHAVEVNPGE